MRDILDSRSPLHFCLPMWIFKNALLVTPLENRGTLTELQWSSTLLHIKASQASSTTTEISSLSNGTRQKTCPYMREKAVVPRSCKWVVPHKKETETKATDKMKQDSKDTWNITVNPVNQVHTQINPCSKQQHWIQKILRGLKNYKTSTKNQTQSTLHRLPWTTK